jgi:hypothetical protein
MDLKRTENEDVNWVLLQDKVQRRCSEYGSELKGSIKSY